MALEDFPNTVALIVRTVIAQHDGPPRGICRSCEPGGWCEMLHWARLVKLSEGLSEPRN